MIILSSFLLKWLERLILYHINEDNNELAKLSASHYGFCAGISTETALHEFVRRVAEVESRTQGSKPRPSPRTQKKSEAKAKDSLSEDRHSRGQGQECSRPRTKDTSASALQKKKKKKVFTKMF